MTPVELSDLVLIPYSSMQGETRRRARGFLVEDLKNPDPDPQSEFYQKIQPFLSLLRMPAVGTPLSKAVLVWMGQLMNYDALFLVNSKAGYQDMGYGHAVFCAYEKPSADGLHLPGLHMFHLFVPGTYQRHGLGTRLCEGMLMEARKRSLSRVRMGKDADTEKSKIVTRIYGNLMCRGEELGVRAIHDLRLGKNWAEIVPGMIPQMYPLYSANISAYTLRS